MGKRLIDADALKKAINGWQDGIQANEPDAIERDFVFDVIRDIVDEQETVTVPQWISVKERLPEKSGYVLVCLHYPSLEQYPDIDPNDVSMAYYAAYNNIFTTDSDEVYNADLSKVDMTDFHEYVTYWMPLPEPPKENTNAEEA